MVKKLLLSALLCGTLTCALCPLCPAHAAGTDNASDEGTRIVATFTFITPPVGTSPSSQTTPPSVHASTIVELQNGDLLAAWFAGEYEGHPDVKIWASHRAKGTKTWTRPVVVADGTFDTATGNGREGDLARMAGLDSTDHGRKSCYNPVLYQMPDGEVLLFYKIGRFVQDWTGWLTRSKDNGYTWTPKEPLPKGFLGPVKNKPILMDDNLLCPSSTEKDGWKIHFERYIIDEKKRFPEHGLLEGKATTTGSIAAEQAEKTFEPGKLSPIGCIQPSILRLGGDSLMVLCRTQNGRLATSYSHDSGRSWTPVTLTALPNNNSGTDAVTLHDGRHVLVYNPVATPTGEHNAPRTPLCVAISDDGKHWQHLITLEDSNISEYSYPAVIEGHDGSIHITYTWRRERVRHVEIKWMRHVAKE